MPNEYGTEDEITETGETQENLETDKVTDDKVTSSDDTQDDSKSTKKTNKSKKKTKTKEPVGKTNFQPTTKVEEKEKEFDDKKADVALVQYINRYLEVLKRKDINKTVKALVSVFAYVFSKPTNDNLNALYKFFNKEPFKSKILAESVIFQGIASIGIRERGRMEIMYTLMRELTTTKRELSLDKARPYLGDEIVTWFAKKRKA